MLFSIITVNRNDAEGLRRTFASVGLHAPEDSEYIVIDGASSDGSVEAIEERDDLIDAWISEPDAGIYDAMNKGIARASGEFCLFLNSGDTLRPENGLGSFVDDGADIYYANAVLSAGGRRTVTDYPRSIDANFFVSGMINHQNALVRRSLFERLGPYDTRYPVCADWLFFLKASRAEKAVFRFLEEPFVEFALGGASNKAGSAPKIRAERERGIEEVFGELAPTMLALVDFRESVYGCILRQFGPRRSLDFLLRAYRYVMTNLKRAGII